MKYARIKMKYILYRVIFISETIILGNAKDFRILRTYRFSVFIIYCSRYQKNIFFFANSLSFLGCCLIFDQIIALYISRTSNYIIQRLSRGFLARSNAPITTFSYTTYNTVPTTCTYIKYYNM